MRIISKIGLCASSEADFAAEICLIFIKNQTNFTQRRSLPRPTGGRAPRPGAPKKGEGPVREGSPDRRDGKMRRAALPKGAEHLLDASLLLLHVRMHIKIQCSADVRMSQESAYRLIVASAFDAPCRETMTQTMELQLWHLELIHEFIVIVAVCTGFDRAGRIGYQEAFPIC